MTVIDGMNEKIDKFWTLTKKAGGAAKHMVIPAEYAEKRVSFLDVIGFGLRVDWRVSWRLVLSSLVWFSLMGFLGFGAERVWEDNHDHTKFDLAVYIISAVCGGILTVTFCIPLCKFVHPIGLFQRATYTLWTYRRSESGDKFGFWFTRSFMMRDRWGICCVSKMSGHDRDKLFGKDDTEEGQNEPRANYLGDDTIDQDTVNSRNYIRSGAFLMHIVYIIGVGVVWSILSNDRTDSLELAVKFRAHRESLRHMAYLWVFAIPTFSGTLLDTIQLSVQGKEKRAQMANRGLYAAYVILLKFLMCAALILLLDPAANYFFDIDKDMTDTEIAVMTITAGTLFILVVLLWASYDCLHYQSPVEKVFAHLEFPACMSLVLAMGWNMTARLRNRHADVATQSVGGDFAFEMTFMVLYAVSLMSTPAHINYGRDIVFMETGNPQGNTSAERASLMANPFKSVRTDDPDDLPPLYPEIRN